MICVFKLSLGSEVKLRKTACQKPDTLSRMPALLSVRAKRQKLDRLQNSY